MPDIPSTDVKQTSNGRSRRKSLIETKMTQFDEGMVGVRRQKTAWEMFLLIVTVPIWYPRSLYAKAQQRGPLPKNFDFTYALVAYYYRATNLVFYTSGLRLASLSFVKTLLEALFSSIPLFVIVFILMPIHAVLIHKKHSLEKLSIIDRRILLVVHSFLSGLLVSHLLRHYISQSSAPPVYFSPAVICLVIYVFGQRLSSSRCLFLLTTVGSATLISFLISATIAGPLTLNSLASIAVQTLCAFLYVQNMIHEVIAGETDLILSNITGLALTMYSYLIYKVLLCPYNPRTFDENLPSLRGVFAS